MYAHKVKELEEKISGDDADNAEKIHDAATIEGSKIYKIDRDILPSIV